MFLCRMFGYIKLEFSISCFWFAATHFTLQCCQCSFIKVMFEVSGPTFNQPTDDWRELALRWSISVISLRPWRRRHSASRPCVLIHVLTPGRHRKLFGKIAYFYSIILYWISLRQWLMLNFIKTPEIRIQRWQVVARVKIWHYLLSSSCNRDVHRYYGGIRSTDHHSSFTFRFISVYMNKKNCYIIFDHDDKLKLLHRRPVRGETK